MVDVLIIAALHEEFEAARLAGARSGSGGAGVASWGWQDTDTPTPYLLGEYVDPEGASFSVALAESVRMGSRTTAALASELTARLRPRCLAMSGVCAGNPASTSLGDVVVASTVYAHDEGKMTTEGFRGDHQQVPLNDRVMRAARDLDISGLPSFAGPTEETGVLWFLETLLSGQEPWSHPARKRYYPRGSWSERLVALEGAGLIIRDENGCVLTESGRTQITRARQEEPDGPDGLPIACVVGPVASGSQVFANGVVWDRLSRMGVRTIAGLDMEAAAIATVAKQQEIPYWFVAKGVMDHAGPDKSDRYKDFASKASAEVMYALLARLARTLNTHRAVGPPPAEPDWRDTMRQKRGLTIWTAELFAAGMATTRSPVRLPPPRKDERVDAVWIADGRLPNLQREFSGLARAFDAWVGEGRRKRDGRGTRVLWLVGDAGSHRGKALLAGAARAGRQGQEVYDVGRNIDLAAEVIEELGLASLPTGPVVVLVDLPAHQASPGWIRLLQALDIAQGAEREHGNPAPALFIGGTAAQQQLAHDILQSSIEITPVGVSGMLGQRANSHDGARSLASRSVPAEHVFNRGLPETTPRLFGRELPLERLREAWMSSETRILCVVAPGGVGKSALVNQWLREMHARDYDGARRVLAWSFYSQGTKDNLVSGDAFVSFALEWLGETGVRETSPVARGNRLAELIRAHRVLLVLDGLEPLQYPENAPEVGGRLTDSSIEALLSGLAEPGWDGLCLITTRVRLRGLAPSGELARPTIDELELDNLGEAAGADLLRYLLDTPLDEETARDLVRGVHGHALAVSLVGRYLREVHGGRSSGILELRDLRTAVADGGHARRIMEMYGEWLAQNGRSGELAILDIIGLFDRPAPYAAMATLLAETELSRSARGLQVGGAEWDRCVEALRRMGLLSGEAAGLPGTLDAHPLVREHFRENLQENDAALWREGNSALYGYYSRRAPVLPDNAADMNLLYAAANHGCAIGLHQEVFDEVLLPRVWRGSRSSYSTRILGMTGSEIVALSNYFEMPRWSELREQPELTQRAKLLVMCNAGLRLRQLGRLDDARDSCAAVLEQARPSPDASDEEMADAAFAASLHSELLVIAGYLRGSEGSVTGEVSAKLARKFADHCEDPYFKMYSRSCLADVYFMAGEFTRARRHFTEARKAAAEPRSDTPFLYSQVLYRYGYFLLETGGAAALLADAEGDPQWGLNGSNSSQLSRAIRELVLVAARRTLIEQDLLGRANLAIAVEQASAVIPELRAVGYVDYTVRGLLEHARLLRVRGNPEDYARALHDLAEVFTETDRGGMGLLAADAYLELLACHLAFWPTMSAEQQAEARPRINEAWLQADGRVSDMKYWRRAAMRDELAAQMEDYGIASDEVE
ncbi:hypothetical protein ABZ848_15460 [Streptomyces sp. NPDC047081]|uniref:hypothetical protein n=1 Tax=Streptomyces sp. NPDC047081 TaxID=3154706 RepID=UPI0033C7E9A5